MRRTSTWAWRLRPRLSWPCVASRRLSWATTRWTAARSCSGPVGSARSSSVSGRLGGSDCVRSICARSSSRRRCGLEAADLVARERRLARGSPSCTGPPGSERSPSARRIRCTSTPSTPGALAAAAEGGDRQPREVAHRRLVAVADRLQQLLAQVVELDPLAAGDAGLGRPRAPRGAAPAPRRRGRRSGRTRGRRSGGPRATWRAWRRARRGSRRAPSTAPRRARRTCR